MTMPIERPAKVPVAGNFQPGMKGEFLEDIVNVAFYRIHGKVELAGDLLVAEPFGDKLHDLPLAARHLDRLKGIPFPIACDMLCDLGQERRGKHCGHHLRSPGHLPDGMEKLGKCRVFQNEAVDTGHNVIHKGRLNRCQIHHNNSGIGARPPDGPDEPQAVLTSEDEIKQDDIDFPEHRLQGFAVAERSDDGEIGLFPEHSAQSFPQEAIILDYSNPDAFHLPESRMEKTVPSAPLNA